jgi:hypothetical protein
MTVAAIKEDNDEVAGIAQGLQSLFKSVARHSHWDPGRARYYPATKLLDEDDTPEKLKQTPASRTRAKPSHHDAASTLASSDLFDEEATVALEALMDDPYEAAERDEIERDHEAETWESEDVEFNELDDTGLEAQLKAEVSSDYSISETLKI